MALPIILAGASAAAPALTKLLGGVFKPKPTKYERELARLSDVFKADAERPYSETAEYNNFLGQINVADTRNRQSLDRQAAATGMTDEAKLAGTQAANNTYADLLRDLSGRATMHRQRAQQNYLGTLGIQGQLEQQRLANHDFNLSQIGANLSGSIGGLAGILNTPAATAAPGLAGLASSAAGMRTGLDRQIPSLTKILYR